MTYIDDVLLVTDLETNLQIDKKPTLLSTLIKNTIVYNKTKGTLKVEVIQMNGKLEM